MNSTSISVPSTPSSDPKAANRARFELELEFVQCLANPYYLHSLAQQNILEQPAFINFLEYLLYWKEKDYARFIQLNLKFCPLSVFAPQTEFSLVIHMPCTIWNCYSMLDSGPK